MWGCAARILGVSRPYLVRLLEGGKIHFTKVGTHRKVALSDLQAFKCDRDTKRRRALDQLFDEMNELDLVDETG